MLHKDCPKRNCVQHPYLGWVCKKAMGQYGKIPIINPNGKACEGAYKAKESAYKDREIDEIKFAMVKAFATCFVIGIVLFLTIWGNVSLVAGAIAAAIVGVVFLTICIFLIRKWYYATLDD